MTEVLSLSVESTKVWLNPTLLAAGGHLSNKVSRNAGKTWVPGLVAATIPWRPQPHFTGRHRLPEEA